MSPARRRALERLRRNRLLMRRLKESKEEILSSAPHTPSDPADALSSAAMASMERRVHDLSRLFGADESVVEFGDLKVRLKRERGARWNERVAVLSRVAQSIARLPQCAHHTEGQILAKLMVADGWIFGRYSIRGPAWLSELFEVRRDRLHTLGGGERIRMADAAVFGDRSAAPSPL